MPIEFQKAYKNGTRSFDGKPGANYWQNSADYNIEVVIIPSKQLIVGSEEVLYHNASPDSLFHLVVRLYHDVNKKGGVRGYKTDPSDLTDGVVLNNLKINGIPYDLKDKEMVRRSGTNLKIMFKTPLPPGDDLNFSISWSQEIPINDTQVGSYDSTTFFIGYWYPQIAVYDDLFGWDELNHDILKEFYNGPANFNVSVLVPRGFLVWGTGRLTNASEVYPSAILERYNTAWSSKDVISIVSEDDINSDLKTGSKKWIFEAKDVSDFSFFLSDHFLWDAVAWEDEGRSVLISTVHPIDTLDYFTNVKLSQDALQFFADDIPGIVYPFESFTTIIADGWGMEFPMMAHNSSPGSSVTVHELLHSYFPMYVHTNETRWGWMDEGLVSHWTQLALMKIYKTGNGVDDIIGKINPGKNIAGTIADLPLLSAEYINERNYGYIIYGKASFIFAMIQQYLGDDLFIKCCRKYINRWAGKSPTPYDLFFTFEDVTKQDLSWIWNPWFIELGSPDVKIQSFIKNLLSIEKVGDQPVPLVIDVMYKDGTTITIKENIGVWKNGNKVCTVSIQGYDQVKEVVVNKHVPDADFLNNIFQTDKVPVK